MTETILKNEERAVFALRDLYRRYGYLPYKMSRFEEYDLYVHNKDFLISDQIITFSDRSGRLLALKPDVTLSIVKNAPEERGVVQKVYYNENVYRDYREIMQAGLECVGDLGDYEISEVMLLAARSLELLGERFVLDVSHMGLVHAVLEGSGLTRQGKKEAAFCLRKKSSHEISALCDREGIGEEARRKLLLLAATRGDGAAVLDQIAAVLTTDPEKQALEELRGLWQLLLAGGYADSVRLDFSVGNDMRYYSGVVFKGYLKGIPASVLSGGQYDGLLQKMGRKARAIGFAIRVDLLQGMDQECSAFDVDTLILHDGGVSAAALSEAVRRAEREGSVLVSRSLPQGRKWKTLIRLERGGENE